MVFIISSSFVENKLKNEVTRLPPKLKPYLQQVDGAYWVNRLKMLYLTSPIMVLSHGETEAITFVCFMPSWLLAYANASILFIRNNIV